MSDYDDDFDSEDAETAPDRNPLRAQMRKMEKELKALREQAESGKQASRALEFAKAGIPLDDPKTKWFLKGYDGELTADAIKAAATESGLLAAAPTDTIPAEEKAAHERIAQGTGTPPGNVDRNAELNSVRTEKEFWESYRRNGGLIAEGAEIPVFE